MKKLLLFLTVTLLGCIGASAQSSLIGTLSHDGEVTVFYGTDALIKAHGAASPGDVITLSAGTFTGTTLTKGITLRGAGMKLSKGATVISGTLSLGASSEEYPLTLEGLLIQKHNITNVLTAAKFIKCAFKANNVYIPKGYLPKAQFINCDIQFFALNNGKTSSKETTDVTFINCVIRYFGCSEDGLGTSHLINSIAFISGSKLADKPTYYTYGTSFTNSIIISTLSQTGERFPSDSVLKNCIIQSKTTNPFTNNNTIVNCTRVDQDFELFKLDSYFMLTEEISETKLGDDGTQIGIYGGSMPFDPIPTNPQITKFNVANKTSADGKLSVDIEVSAAQ